jgi:hypothetical protein
MTQNRARKATQSRPASQKQAEPDTKQEETKVEEGQQEPQNAAQSDEQGKDGDSGQEDAPKPAESQQTASGITASSGAPTESGDNPDEEDEQDDEQDSPEDPETDQKSIEEQEEELRKAQEELDARKKARAGEMGEPVTNRSEPEGHIIRPGEPVRVIGRVVGNQVQVSQDTYREVIPWRSKRSTFVLVYTAGTLIPKSSLVNFSEEPDEDDESNDNVTAEVK